MKVCTWCWILCLAGLTLPAIAEPRAEEPAAAEETATVTAGDSADVETEPPVVFEAMQVVGTGDRQREIPGSAHYLGPEELERQDYGDVHRILLNIPGVVVQEEEGYGLRPNIGMRGTGTERSSKVTLLEDGVLIAPAPYAAPSAYYFPVAGRMEAFEVRKGSSAILQGPFTNGGVLNMISTSIPSTFGGRVGVVAGEDATLRGHARVGESRDRFGWLLETYRFETDGFKDLDGGGDTGVSLEDYLGKARFHSRADSRGPHMVLELKLGRTDQFGDETYLGLTQEDFDRTPLRRYAASQLDTIDTEHEQAQLRWLVQATADLDVTTTAYRNDFFRNWDKLQSVEGRGIGSVVGSPDTFIDELAVLRGDADGDLRLRNNRRDYYGQGLQSIVGWTVDRRHRLELGVRYHEDQEDRFQEEDAYRMTAGRLVLDALGRPGSQANRVSDAEALALFVQDRIDLGRLTLTPGVRFESIDFTRTDYGRNDPGRTGSDLAVRRNGVDVLIPGLGAAYRATDRLSWFGGVHKGFSPPGPGSSAETDAEESVNYEAGVRYLAGRAELQATLFANDYDNLLGRDTLSGGGEGTGDLFNGGEVSVRGLEAALSRSFETGTATLPVRLAYTFTRAEFDDSFESDFDPWGTVTAGDELPYLPEHLLTGSLGYVRPQWSAHLNGSWVSEMRTAAGSGPIAAGEGVDDHFLLDLAADRSLGERLTLRLQVRNLTDEVYVAARRPAGARPGLPRTVTGGFAWTF